MRSIKRTGAKVLTLSASLVVTLLATRSAQAATWYVAPTGSDSAAGTMAAPFATWGRAQTAASAGDTVIFRGGTYKYTTATTNCGKTTDTVNSIVLSKSGASGNPIRYVAYDGERPIFDFSGVTDMSHYNCRHVGVSVEADWLYLKGLEFKGVLQLNGDNHESWCVYVNGGSNNTYELLDAHHNMGPGFFIQAGGNNKFLNCDSHENEDELTSNGDGQSADGFGCHPKRVGDTGNLFHGCRGWWNSDDTWDFINAKEACTVEYSWAWFAGYKPDAISGGKPVPLPAGNGNGIKGGGYGDPQTNVPSPAPQHVIRFNASFYNKDAGFYANHEIVSPFFYNNTSFNNGVQFNLLGLNGSQTTSVGTLRNNIAYSNAGHSLLSNNLNSGPISDQFNSWDTNMNLKVTDADFKSLAMNAPASCPAPFAAGGEACCSPTDMNCFSGLASARLSDGSLPVLPFLRLASTSAMIAKGTELGFPHSGKAPDLGCFDTGLPFDSDGGASLSGTFTGGTGTSGTSVAADSGVAMSGDSTGTTGASTGSSGSTTSGASGTDSPGATGTASDEAGTATGALSGTSADTSASAVTGGATTGGSSGSGLAPSGKGPESGGCNVQASGEANTANGFAAALCALGIVAARRTRRRRVRA